MVDNTSIKKTGFTFNSNERRCSRCWVGREKSGGLAVQEDSRRHSAWDLLLKGLSHEMDWNLVDIYGYI